MGLRSAIEVEDNNPLPSVYMTADEVRRELRVAIAYEGIHMKTWAARHGFSIAFVSAVLTGRKGPSERLCEAMGIRKLTTYVRVVAP